MLQGLPFHSGGVGVELCLPDVAQPLATIGNRPQPFTTIRNRSREVPMAVPMVSFAKGVTFDISSVASRRFAWQAWHFVTFQHVSRCVKSFFCVAGAMLLRRFQKMRCIFCGSRSTLATSIVTLRGSRITSDVSCSVFLPIALSGPREVVTTCKFCGRRGILSHVMKIDGSLAQNVDFEL